MLRPLLNNTGLHRIVRSEATFILEGFVYITLHNPIRATAQKSLRFVGDAKTNPVCALPGKASCTQQTRYASVENWLCRVRFRNITVFGSIL